jgi:hypothetical protein
MPISVRDSLAKLEQHVHEYALVRAGFETYGAFLDFPDEHRDLLIVNINPSSIPGPGQPPTPPPMTGSPQQPPTAQ